MFVLSSCMDGVGNISIPVLLLIVRESYTQQFASSFLKLSLEGHIKRIIKCNCHAGFLN